MKAFSIFAATLLIAASAFAQGEVVFNNHIGYPGGGLTERVSAPIFGVDPADPGRQKTGNPIGGYPSGTQTYGGPLLAGTGYTVQLWGGPLGTPEDQLQLCVNVLREAGGGWDELVGPASTTFRTGAGAGYFVPLAHVRVPNAPTGSRGSLQLRAWDNLGGTVTSWDGALADPTHVAHGASALFAPPYNLGGVFPGPAAPLLPPTMIGLESFNLTLLGVSPEVPEPSVFALGLLGVGALFFFRSPRRAK